MKTSFSYLLSFAIICSSSLLVIEAGTPCRSLPMNPDDCCKMPQIENEGALMGECVTMFGEQTGRERADKDAFERGCCIAECIMNGTGRADLSEGNLVKMDTMKAEMMGMLNDWEPIIKGASKMCVAEAMKHAQRHEEGFKLGTVGANDMLCHPKYVFMLVCHIKEYVMKCPAKYYTDTPQCMGLKKHLHTCDM